MTAKKKTQKDAKDKDESRGGLYDERGNDHNPLTRELSIELLEKLLSELYEHAESEPCDDFLLLLYALTHEPDKRERWIIYEDARRVFAAAVSGVDDTIDAALVGALDRLKGGAR